LGITLSSSFFWILAQPWVVRWAWPLCIFVISFTYFLTALAGILSPTGEYQTTAVLFILGASTTATIVPWGVRGQLPTVLVGATCLAAAVHIAGGAPSLILTDPAVATIIAFGFSVAVAGELDRYRIGHRRELLKRRRGELEIRRLNARLEQRVL